MLIFKLNIVQPGLYGKSNNFSKLRQNQNNSSLAILSRTKQNLNLLIKPTHSNQKQMLLKYPSTHFQSIHELKKFSSKHSLEKFQNSQLPKTMISSSLSLHKLSSKQFVPFCRQRDLGKLLSNKKLLKNSEQQNNSIEKLLEMVNFKNFKKLYRMEKKSQESKYAQKIRLSGQKNLIKFNQWVLNDIRQKSSSLNQSNIRKLNQNSRINSQSNLKLSRQVSQQSLRSCCKSPSFDKHPKNSSNFRKIDLQLYKKMAAYRPPTDSNPQLNNLYEHYVQSCQLNQNERRSFLTKRYK